LSKIIIAVGQSAVIDILFRTFQFRLQQLARRAAAIKKPAEAGFALIFSG
jgi:hypothetical protein